MGKSRIGKNIIGLFQSAISTFKGSMAQTDFYIKIQQRKRSTIYRQEALLTWFVT